LLPEKKGGLSMNKEFAKGDVIFRAGDTGDCFYDVVKGTVGIYSDYGTDAEQKLTETGEGHIVGELALIDAYPRSATAVALTDVVLTEVSVDEVRKYFDEDHEKITFLIKELGERLTRLTKDYTEACETIQASYPQDKERKPGIAEKIKRFAAAYKMAKKNEAISGETYKTLTQSGHGSGFSKTVDTYNKGDIIFREGEPGRCMYDIHTGSINIYSGYGTPDEKLLTTLGTDKFFGEIGLISSSPRTATAVANMDRTMVESIAMDDFDELYTKNPVKIEMVIKHLAGRIRKLTDQYTDACKVLYKVAEADANNASVDEAKKEVEGFASESVF
jgi:CRP-like cAMP-binding protein